MSTLRAPLHRLPASVRANLQHRKVELATAAYERRHKARELLFSKGGGSMQRLAPAEKTYVRMVHEEAYQAYLHLFRTGESRYQGWKKRRQLQLQNQIEPMNRKKHWVVWYGSQKARWLRELSKKVKEAS